MDLETRTEINMRRERANLIEMHLNEHSLEMDDASIRYWEAALKYERAMAKMLEQLSPPGPDSALPPRPGRPAKVQP